MLRRLQRLYVRYMTHHLHLSLGTVRSADGAVVAVTLKSGRVLLEGNGILDHGGARAQGPTPSLPYDPKGATRVSLRDTRRIIHPLPAVPAWRRIGAHAALWPWFIRRLCTLVPLLPNIRDPHVRASALRRLGLTAMSPAPHLCLSPLQNLSDVPHTGVILILPVHNAADHVNRCLDRIPTMTDLPWRLILVDDGSTDPVVAPMLASCAARDCRVTLIRHTRPRGFAGAVNAALEHIGAVTTPVILLNSDVTLPHGWASRLIAPLLADGTIASVTPLSNEGELMGAPHACRGVSLRDTEVDSVDAALAAFARATDLPSLPTGTGFCMALSPLWLEDVPRFDDRFGRGYGEEVDWCQRTRALGGRHVCQTGLFVGHVGAASFGRSARRALRRKAAPVLTRRWPRFDSHVACTLANDPLAGDRLRAGLLWARARLNGDVLSVYLTHSLGGGTERWLEQRLSEHPVAVVVRVGGALRWEIELHSQAGVTRAATNGFSDVLSLLKTGGPRNVIYTCAVGDPRPEEIPFRLLDLCAGGQGLEILFHDYFPLHRDYTFRSEPDPEWQALWRPALDRADHLTVFSDASRRIVAGVHPDLAHKLRVRQHGPLGPVPRLTPARTQRPVIGVPGNLNAQKGASAVADLARVFDRTREARIVVLGEVAPECPLPRSVRVLGGYNLADLPHLVVRHEIGVWLIPSLWPETFSYVTHESLATGLPTLGFDLGGQADALRASEAGHVVSLRNDGSADPDALVEAFRRLPEWPSQLVKTGSIQRKFPLLARGRV